MKQWANRSWRVRALRYFSLSYLGKSAMEKITLFQNLRWKLPDNITSVLQNDCISFYNTFFCFHYRITATITPTFRFHLSVVVIVVLVFARQSSPRFFSKRYSCPSTYPAMTCFLPPSSSLQVVLITRILYSLMMNFPRVVFAH